MSYDPSTDGPFGSNGKAKTLGELALENRTNTVYNALSTLKHVIVEKFLLEWERKPEHSTSVTLKIKLNSFVFSKNKSLTEVIMQHLKEWGHTENLCITCKWYCVKSDLSDIVAVTISVMEKGGKNEYDLP